MSSNKILSFITVDNYLATPKYLQVTGAIQSAIKNGQIKPGDVLPSLNELTFALDISRDTAEKAYKYLKNIGVLGSIPGKGYFVEQTEIQQTLKVFLIFNKLSAHKKIIYDALIEALGTEVIVDFYVYNNDYALFKKIVNERKDDYTHYVVIPHFVEGGEQAFEILNTLPKEKLILLDKLLPGVVGEYGAVYENFEYDIYGALEQAVPELRKYEILKIIFPEKSYFPMEIITGFQRFCRAYGFPSEILSTIEADNIKVGDLYINLMEGDLVALLEGILAKDLVIGKQVGLISYNETPLKKFILNGITTISTDFQQMGAQAAKLILEKSHQHIKIPFSLIKRASL